MSEPTTAAGRKLALWNHNHGGGYIDVDDILAIETEARQQDGSALRAIVDRLIQNDLAFGKPLMTEYPSRAALRSDMKALAAALFDDSILEQDR